jgi:hypothetical protein
MPVYMIRRARPPTTVLIRSTPITSSKSIAGLLCGGSSDRVIPSKIARTLLRCAHNSHDRVWANHRGSTPRVPAY